MTQEKLTDSFTQEIMRCVKCPIVNDCPLTNHKLKKLRLTAIERSEEVYEEEIELDDSAENKLRAEQKRDNIYNAYIQDNAYKVLENEKCKYEKEEIIKILTYFVETGYNLNDPRAYLIVKELIGNILNSGRANKAFTSLGILLRKDTASGPIYYKNPLLDTKMEFSKLITESTEALDRIMKSDEAKSHEHTFTNHLLKQLKQYKTVEKQKIQISKDIAIEHKERSINEEMEEEI